MSDGKKHLFTPFRTNHWAQKDTSCSALPWATSQKGEEDCLELVFFFFFFPFFPPVIDRVTKTEGETVSRYL